MMTLIMNTQWVCVAETFQYRCRQWPCSSSVLELLLGDSPKDTIDPPCIWVTAKEANVKATFFVL